MVGGLFVRKDGGLVHNLGNAMTALGANVDRLQHSLRDAPAAEAELVIAELERDGCDQERRHDLERLLRITCRELANAITVAQDGIDAIDRQAQTVCAVLAQEGHSAKFGPLLSMVSLPELLRQSTDLVAQPLCDRLALEIDESLHAIGPVRLARTTLQQVFQNLIVNAAEAMRDAGRATGTLRVSAVIEPGAAGGGEQLRCCFDDDGGGIAAADLNRMFNRGFSTKPGPGHSGIGLHWCAGVVRELGGRMYAESGGARRGCRVYVVLPLERAAPERIPRVA